ncbi:hypothetical protein EVG20_g989 [Dentipellis fragilis]|uniref:Uncharacterized protein n=1 Tax=Dentipellis fragilis TaxID=205917 RepID=A0A4Y9ZDF9_9AGAM|nr:hypothetical protein EVG20_g989 [Dentipellis fragilis]
METVASRRYKWTTSVVRWALEIAHERERQAGKAEIACGLFIAHHNQDTTALELTSNMSSYTGPCPPCTSRDLQQLELPNGFAVWSSNRPGSGPYPTQYWVPAHSSRFEQLMQEHEGLLKEFDKTLQWYQDGLITTAEYRRLDEDWTSRERAKSREIDEEMNNGPQSQQDRLRSWGCTEEHVAEIDRARKHEEDVHQANRERSRGCFLRRRAAQGF